MRTPLLTLLLASLMFSHRVYAQFRCGTRIADIGDYKAEVLKKCGPPTTQQRFPGSGGTKSQDFGDPQYDPNDQGMVEEWIYDLGSRRLKQYLRFENGRLQETRSLGYGE